MTFQPLSTRSGAANRRPICWPRFWMSPLLALTSKKKLVAPTICLILATFTFLNFYLVKLNAEMAGAGIPGGSASEATLYKPKHNYQLKLRRQNLKLVLLWTKSWSARTEPVNGWDLDDQTLKNCPVKCDFTDDKDLLDLSHAVVYHGVNWDSWNLFGLPDLPKRRPNLNQIWTFLRIESPANDAHSFAKFDGRFNWTATYRLDSDVPFLYGGFENVTESPIPMPGRSESPLQLQLRSESSSSPRPSKSIPPRKLVGWMVSNCNVQSKRHLLVAKLQKFIPVDVFGTCSSAGTRLNCPGEHCYATFAKKYKFWLAFEKALCVDYLSEKFYLPLYFGMVPVLYAHPSVLRLIPPGSFINVDDFSSMKDLANYLIYLDQNPEEYAKYFEWKKTLRVSLQNNFWCEFCSKLHRVGGGGEGIFGESGASVAAAAGQRENFSTIGTWKMPRKVYESVDRWFYYNNTDKFQCDKPSGSLFEAE